VSHRNSFPPVHDLVPGEGQLRAVFHTSLGDFTVALFEDIAPNTVSNFVGLATGRGDWLDPTTGEPGQGGYYDGVIFHRVIPGFVIQGGDRTGTGRGGPGYTFDDECSPSAMHTGKGVLSMANDGIRSGRGTNGSQFFVTLGETPHLDGKYTVFGEIIDGMDTLERIGSTKTGFGDRPIKDVKISTIEIIRV
jgi:peptidyl-prolyl cis-trans isomerase A (cyclophilin A)